jgi:hypothetical protein
MQSRKRILIALSGITLFLAWFAFNALSIRTWATPDMLAIHVVIDNRTDFEIGPFTIVDAQDAPPVPVNAIAPRSVVDLDYEQAESWGENVVILIDSEGREYDIVPYFENGQKGRVDIRIDCASPAGLAGVKRELISWYFSFKWRSWGFEECFELEG